MSDLPRILAAVVLALASLMPAAFKVEPVGRSGTATWYDAPTIHDAAAGPPLRFGHWRGSTVKVCTGSACVIVRLTDWCACPNHILDLDDQAFKRLAPLSQGVVRVRVTVVGAIDVPVTATAPPTDVGP